MLTSILTRLFHPRLWFAESIIKHEIERQLRSVEEDAHQPDLCEKLCNQAMLLLKSSCNEMPRHAAFTTVWQHQRAEVWKRVEQSTTVAKDESSWWPEYRTDVTQHIHSILPYCESSYDEFVHKLHDSGKLDTYDSWLRRHTIDHLIKARELQKRRQRQFNADCMLRRAFTKQTGRDAESYSAASDAVSRLAESDLGESDIEVIIVEEPREEEQKVYESCQTYQCWGACDICQNPENHWHFQTVQIPGRYEFRVKEPITTGK